VAPDLRGYGDTEKPTGIDKYTLKKLATDIKHLIQGDTLQMLFHMLDLN
jgi:pimeloyl-ACP methyl ester carboxylesterase